MSDSEMIEYEINDDLNESLDNKNLAEVQIKNNNDINLHHKKTNYLNLNKLKNKSLQKEKNLQSKNTKKLAIETNLNKILQGKTTETKLERSVTTKNADSNQKNNSINSNGIKKNSFNYSSNAKKYQNFSTEKNYFISKNVLKEFNIINNNDSKINKVINTEYPENVKVTNQYNNFNTIGNFDTEGFLSNKNKYASTFKMFGNTNRNNKDNNTINNSAMKNHKKSIDIEKTKTITNNKTDFKTINSNNINYSKNTFIAANEKSKNNKFEVKLKDRLNSLKNNKSIPVNASKNKEHLTKKAVNYPKTTSKDDKNITNSNIKFNQKIHFNNNNNNKTHSYLNLKLNLDPSLTSNVQETDLNYANLNTENPQTTKNDNKIKFLLSEQFKSSLNTSLRNNYNNNKSFQSNYSKLNKSNTKNSLISFDLSKQIDNQRSLSIGERLYRKSIAIKNLKEKRVSIELSRKNMETISNCSFKPRICEDSIMMSIKSKYATISNLEDSINHQNQTKDFDSSYFIKHKSKLIESHRLKREMEDLRELRPSIKKPETEIKKITEKLHNEKITLQAEREKLADLYFSEIYPFKPSINNTKDEPNIESFYNRLQEWVEKRNENYQKDLQESLIDDKTGQRLFKPLINEASEHALHRNEMDLYTFLHEERRNKLEKLYEIEQISKKYFVENCNTKHSNNKTNEINKLLKEDCYSNLFNILDHNSDGVVECNETFLENAQAKLDKNLFDLFKPIFSELKEHEESLSRDEFSLALDELFKVLSVDERRRIINWYVELKRTQTHLRKKSSAENAELTFQPKINDNSQNYFNFSKRYSKNFLDRNDEFINSRDAFKTEKSKEKIQKELGACTFKPEINKKSEELDKRNKLAFLLNLNNSDLNVDFLLKPKSKEKINNLSRI